MFQSAAGILLLIFLALQAVPARAGENARYGENAWGGGPFIRFLDAAVVRGDRVLLGEVAVPVGGVTPERWEKLAVRELWPAPPESGRAMNMTRPKLQEAVMMTMKDLAPYCLFPGSMVLRRGGVLVGGEEIRSLVEKQLTSFLSALPGEVLLKDFRLPRHIFLEHAGQELVMETPRRAEPGRVGVRLLVLEVDGTVRQKLSGTVSAECWADVPCAVVGMNRDDLLDHGKITYKRMNLAGLRGEPWDGRGGPWRLVRPLSIEQVICRGDLAPVPTVRKGTTVTVLYEGKNVRLAAQAEALADGAAGESIPVRNLQSRKEVFAQVRDAQTVGINAARGFNPQAAPAAARLRPGEWEPGGSPPP
ncbi:MAG: flagellar basal body P-ring formation chaperone FlgA [Desulfovibrio sp.]|jgi:flagella basal body P-ring formation protein FlgA|nr:flagellar basal body P-ring formation chaperone FlgA [Desulfovibrio sp.]